MEERCRERKGWKEDVARSRESGSRERGRKDWEGGTYRERGMRKWREGGAERMREGQETKGRE